MFAYAYRHVFSVDGKFNAKIMACELQITFVIVHGMILRRHNSDIIFCFIAAGHYAIINEGQSVFEGHEAWKSPNQHCISRFANYVRPLQLTVQYHSNAKPSTSEQKNVTSAHYVGGSHISIHRSHLGQLGVEKSPRVFYGIL